MKKTTKKSMGNQFAHAFCITLLEFDHF
ncbi:zinc-finger domain-containing protein [Kurthia massiliensis]